MNIRFRHTCLKVKDLAASTAFYCEHLGFVEGPSFVDADSKKFGTFLYLNHGVFLELFTGEPGVFTGHLCFEVADIHATVKTLRDKGISLPDPSLGRSKTLLTGFKDPDGNAIELNEYSPPDSWIGRFLAERDPGQRMDRPAPSTP
jgi:catechol 2,3-dioxygenase-like lactoylglutathione lyase family enzyme